MNDHMERKGSGFIVITKTGKRGRTFHKEPVVNGKLRVYLDKPFQLRGGKKLNKVLCEPESLTIKGFID